MMETIKHWVTDKLYLLKLRMYLIKKSNNLIKLMYSFPLQKHYNNEEFYVEVEGKTYYQKMQINYLP